MLVRPVDFNGMIQNTNQVQNEKQTADTRPEMQQNLMQTENVVRDQVKSSSVQTENKSGREEFDPEEGGDGTGYTGNHGRRKGASPKKPRDSGRVIRKGAVAPFDIKI